MKEDNEHAKDFAALSDALLREMADRGYNDFAVEVAGYDLKHIGEYLAGRGATAYSPAMGEGFLSEWPLSPSGRIRFESLIHKLDDICRDGKFKIAHCAQAAHAPPRLGRRGAHRAQEQADVGRGPHVPRAQRARRRQRHRDDAGARRGAVASDER